MDAIVNAIAEKTSDSPNVSITWERAIESQKQIIMEIPVGYLKRKMPRWTSGILKECIKTDRRLLCGNDSALCGLGVAEFLDISESMFPTKSILVAF